MAAAGGTWFAYFCVEDGQEPPLVRGGPAIGVDVGVGTMAACSDPIVVENPKRLFSSPSEKHGWRGVGVRWFEPEIGGVPDGQRLPAI